MAYNANQIGLELHGNFDIYTNKLDRLIRKHGKQEVLEMNWDGIDEYSPFLLNNYSNHKEQSRIIKSNYEGHIGIHTVVKQYAVSTIKKYIREHGKPVTRVKKAVAKPILDVKKTEKVKTEETVVLTKEEIKEIKDKAFERGLKQGKREEKAKNNTTERQLRNQIGDLKAENSTLKTIAKQSVLNNIQIMKAVGIEVTQQDLDL